MTIENQLKNLICDKYGSMRNFARKIEISQSTLATILRRGVQNASISTVLKICDALEISVDALAENKIIPKQKVELREYKDFDFIFDQMLIDGKELTQPEKINMTKMFHNDVDLIRQNRELITESNKLLLRSGNGFVALDVKTGKMTKLVGQEIEKLSSDMADNGVRPQDIVISSNDEKSIELYLEAMEKTQELEKERKS